jgi:hypothetical protein
VEATGLRPLPPPTPPDMRFSASGGWNPWLLPLKVLFPYRYILERVKKSNLLIYMKYVENISRNIGNKKP